MERHHLIIATGNMNKMREIREILGDLPVEIVSMKEAGISADIVEDGTTFEENAIIKATAVAKASGKMALADDSGLVIDALGGEPGIYSARYMGEDTSYVLKNASLIERVNRKLGELDEAAYIAAASSAADSPGAAGDGCVSTAGTREAAADGSGSTTGVLSARTRVPGEGRSARFVCAVAVVWPDGRKLTTQGVMEGRIDYAPHGENGFGYDPIFYLPEYQQTSAELSREEKNGISHRGKALREMRRLLGENLRSD